MSFGGVWYESPLAQLQPLAADQAMTQRKNLKAIERLEKKVCVCWLV